MTEDQQIPEDPDESQAPTRPGAPDAAGAAVAVDTTLVARVRAGDPEAFGRLYDRWFERVHDLAFRILWDADAAADVAQDTFLSAWRNLDRLDDPRAFGGWLLRIARNRALDATRERARAQPAHQDRLAMIERAQTRPEDRMGTLDDPARVAEDADLAALLWSAAGALGERDRDVLDLHVRHGLAPHEIADVVGLNRNAANQLVHRVRERLATAVAARLLWRGGAPVCATLRDALAVAGVDEFGTEAVRLTARHAAACEACEERQRTHLSPAQMFSAVPFLALPAYKAKVAAALSDVGVPMQGSSAIGSEGPHGRGPRDGGARGDRLRRGRARRVVVAAGAVVAVVVAVIAVGASRAGDDRAVRFDAAEPATSAAPATTGAAASGPTAPTTAAPTTVAPAVPPPTAGPAPAAAPDTPGADAPGPTADVPATTSPPAAAPTVAGALTTVAPAVPVAVERFELSPDQAPASYTSAEAPQLAWSVSGAHTVVVTGPGGFSSGAVSGAAPVCPGGWEERRCTAPRGRHTYTLDAYDAAGELVAHDDAVLHIG